MYILQLIIPTSALPQLPGTGAAPNHQILSTSEAKVLKTPYPKACSTLPHPLICYYYYYHYQYYCCYYNMYFFLLNTAEKH